MAIEPISSAWLRSLAQAHPNLHCNLYTLLAQLQKVVVESNASCLKSNNYRRTTKLKKAEFVAFLNITAWLLPFLVNANAPHISGPNCYK